MSKLHKIQFPLYFPDENPVGGGGNLNADKILDILNDDSPAAGEELDLDNKDNKAPRIEVDDEPEPEPEPEVDEKDELEELEEELDEDKDELDEDELELITPVKRKAILAKYPKLFEDFPYIEKAWFREQQYSEIFPNPVDAKAALEKAQTLDEFEQKILAGDLSTILSVVKGENDQSYKKLVDSYLPTLQKVDPDAFFHVVNSIVKPIIYNMYQMGNQNGDEEITKGAAALNKFFYNTTKWEPHQPLVNDKNNGQSEEAKKLQEERAQLFTERYQIARTDLGNRVESTFKKAIEKYIDPKSEMTDYVRRNATREAQEVLGESLSKDTRLKAVLDKAWKRAGESNFSKDSMDNIRKIINARAQTVLPTVIKKARMEALRGMGKRVRDNSTESNSNDKARPSSLNRGPLKPASNNRGSTNNKMEIPKNVSSKDFIMSD